MKQQAKASILAGLLAMTVMITGCSKQGALGDGGKVATVDGQVITKTQYDKAFGEFEKAYSMEKLPAQQRSAFTDMVKQMALNKLIYEALLYSEAGKAGVTVSQADVDKYKQEKIFSNPALKEQYKQFLAGKSMSEADFDAALKDTLLQNKFVEVKGGKDVQVTDGEVKTFFDKNPDQFKLPERIQARHILVKAVVPEMKRELREKNPKITDSELEKTISVKEKELKAKADKLFADVKANPNKFADLAKANSDDTVSAQQGGELGPMVEAHIDPAFWAAMEKTPVGQMHPGIVHTQFGYHIIKVEGKEPARKENFAEAAPMIKDFLAQQKKQAFLMKWAEQKKSTAKIVIEPAYQPKAAETSAAPGQPQGTVAGPEGVTAPGAVPAAGGEATPVAAQPAQKAAH